MMQSNIMIEGKKAFVIYRQQRKRCQKSRHTKNVSIDYIFSAFINGRNNIKPQLYLSIHDEE